MLHKMSTLQRHMQEMLMWEQEVQAALVRVLWN